MKIAILGAGSWGTALGQVLHENGSEVLLWHLEEDFADKINRSHEHPFLPGVKLSSELHFTYSLDAIIEYANDHSIEMDIVPKLITKPLKEKLEVEARKLHFLPGFTELPI